MSLLGWMVGLGIANSLLDEEEKREGLKRKNKELASEQQRLNKRIEELEREVMWGRRGY